MTGRGQVAGRHVWLVEARARETPEWPPRPPGALPVGADRYVIAVDVERGVGLRIEAALGGQPFSITEVTTIEFDVAIPDEVFVSAPPEPPIPRPERVSIEEAARRAPFTVFVPARVPAESRLVVHYAAAHEHRPVMVRLS